MVFGLSATQARTLSPILERTWAKISKLEQIPDEFSRAFGNHDGIRFGDRLQPCSEVGRLTDDAALLRLARSN
jgi:hypothetical protein